MEMKTHKYPFEFWITNLSKEKKNCPLIYLRIPGSHNTFSYTISYDADISPDSPLLVQRLSRVFKCIVNPVVYKWSRTQYMDITNQLREGIRYLDIRLVNHKGDILSAHGLLGLPIVPLLQETDTFLKEHCNEILILDFQHFYQFTNDTHIQLLEYIVQIFGSKLCLRKRNISDLTIQSMLALGEQVVVIYREELESQYVWPSHDWPTPWPNKVNVSELLHYLDEELKCRPPRIGLITQCILTVDLSYVLRHPFMNLTKLVNRANAIILNWIKAQTHLILNVVIADFVNSEFVETVINK